MKKEMLLVKGNKGFKDPLANTNKHAKVMILRPNETPEIITETRYTNMNKKLIRLTESDLHNIVKESVNRILKESLDSHMMIDDKNRVFDTFKNLVHVMIWENGNIGGDENTLIEVMI